VPNSRQLSLSIGFGAIFGWAERTLFYSFLATAHVL